jgi:PKD repeat protein
VRDQAGNENSYPLTAVVADVTAPTGTFSVSPASAWANWTVVSVSQSALSDDLSASDKIARMVDWGDGSTDAWTAGASFTHVYTTAGSYSPTVTIADEAGNTAVAATSTVDVAVDEIAPTTRLLAPAHKRLSVRSWATLHGRANDSGTGVRVVRVRAIEKRGSVWYAYRPGTKSWVRAGSRAASAWHKARAARVTTDASHLWSVKLARLTRGVLVTKVSATDNVGNVSAWKARTVMLSLR